MNRIKQLCNLIDNCQCVYDVGSDHALLAINLLKSKKVKKVVNIEKSWQPHNIGKTNLAKNHLTTKTINVLNDGLKDITKKVFIQPNYIVIAGMGGKNIVEILNTKDNKINKNTIYILEANCDVDVLRKHLAKNKWDILFEDVCLDRSKYYQIIATRQGTKARKINCFEACFGQANKQKNQTLWLNLLKTTKSKIESKKLNKVSTHWDKLYKAIKEKI